MRFLLLAVATIGLGGCVVVPYDPGYYPAEPGYYGYAPPAATFSYNYSPGWRHHHHRRWHWH